MFRGLPQALSARLTSGFVPSAFSQKWHRIYLFTIAHAYIFTYANIIGKG